MTPSAPGSAQAANDLGHYLFCVHSCVKNFCVHGILACILIVLACLKVAFECHWGGARPWFRAEIIMVQVIRRSR